MKHAWFKTTPLLIVTVLALGLGIVESSKSPAYFSPESLENLRALNYEHQMAVLDLRSMDRSALVSELLHADAFEADKTRGENQGLVVSTENGGLLLLEPVVKLSELELETLAQDYEASIPEFSTVELDQELSVSSPFYDWDFEFSKDSEVSSENTVDLASEEKVLVAVIDSGIDKKHEIFTDTTILKGWNALDHNSDVTDDVGHGTHIAGIIASKAPGVELVSYKIVDKNGGKLSNVLEAFSHAIDDEVDVINTSFGISSESPSLKTMVDEAHAAGIIVVSAAGNNSSDDGFYPAENEYTIAVASTDASGNKLAKSNYGSWIDVAAFGYHVRSALPNEQYGYLTGTSQSTAIVSAAVARLLQAPHTSEWTYQSLLSALKSACTSQISSGELAGTPIVQ